LTTVLGAEKPTVQQSPAPAQVTPFSTLSVKVGDGEGEVLPIGEGVVVGDDALARALHRYGRLLVRRTSIALPGLRIQKQR